MTVTKKGEKNMTYTKNAALAWCKEQGYSARVETVKYGYDRVAVDCETSAEFDAVAAHFGRIKDAVVDGWRIFEATFEGRIYLMAAADRAALYSAMAEEAARVEDWWARYHAADAETRRLMASGTVA
jgi:hypothetical protein